MKTLLPTITICLILISCDNNPTECHHGTVIMSSCCSGTTFIELDLSTPIGKATLLNGVNYKNMIQVPGYLPEGEIYLKLRKFNQPEDDGLLPTAICYCLIGVGMDVPLFIQTSYSSTDCNVGED